MAAKFVKNFKYTCMCCRKLFFVIPVHNLLYGDYYMTAIIITMNVIIKIHIITVIVVIMIVIKQYIHDSVGNYG